MDALEPAQIYDTAQVSQPFEPAAVRAESSAHQRMLASIPKLRVFAILLCRDRDRADDLVQDSLIRACANISLFETRHQHACVTVRDLAKSALHALPASTPTRSVP
jgi:Sigma2 domain of PhyR